VTTKTVMRLGVGDTMTTKKDRKLMRENFCRSGEGLI